MGCSNVPDDYNCYWTKCPRCKEMTHPAEGGCVCEFCEKCKQLKDPSNMYDTELCIDCYSEFKQIELDNLYEEVSNQILILETKWREYISKSKSSFNNISKAQEEFNELLSKMKGLINYV